MIAPGAARERTFENRHSGPQTVIDPRYSITSSARELDLELPAPCTPGRE
jgi:hypothetical protein